MVRSERFAAAAAIFRMSGLLFDFMISGKKSIQGSLGSENPSNSTGKPEWRIIVLYMDPIFGSHTLTSHHILPAAPPPAWALPVPRGPAVAAPAAAQDLARPWPSRCSARCRCPCTYLSHTFYPRAKKSNMFSIPAVHGHLI